jgi:hypothetical protein
VDQDFRVLFPLMAESDDLFEEKLLAAWEAKGTVPPRTIHDGTPRILDPRVQPAPFTQLPRRTSPRRWVQSTLALAACCAIIAGSLFLTHETDPIVWSDAEIVQSAHYRGSTGLEKLPVYTRGELELLTSSLRESVETELENMSASDKKAWQSWMLSTRIQELDSGRLAIKVQAFRARGKKPAKEWLKNYSDAESLRAKIDEYGRQIVRDLAQLSHYSQDFNEQK